MMVHIDWDMWVRDIWGRDIWMIVHMDRDMWVRDIWGRDIWRMESHFRSYLPQLNYFWICQISLCGYHLLTNWIFKWLNYKFT